MSVSLFNIRDELADYLERWKQSAADKSWRINANLCDDSLMLATDTSSWPFINRNEIDDFGPGPEALDLHFAKRAISIMQQDAEIKTRLRGKTYSLAS